MRSSATFTRNARPVSGRQVRRFARATVGYAGLLATAALVIVPVLWSLSASFTPLVSVFANTSPFTWRALLPVDFTPDAYAQVLGDPVFVRSVINSAVISAISVAVGIVIAAGAGFAFAKFQFRGRDALFGLVLLTFMVPIEAIVIPMFSMMRGLGWLNTWQGLIIPGLANGLVVFLFRQFFREFPSALIEAARVDGGSWPTILLRIVFPLSRPVLLSAALLLWIATWNSYFWPLVVAPTEDLRVVQVASAAVTEHNVLWPRLFAGSVVATLVPLLLVLPFQRYYVRSIAGIGVKG